MTAMIGEKIENDLADNDYDHDHDYDDEDSIPEMFHSSSGLFDSLDKLTNEIIADLMTDEENAESVTGSSSNDDEDDYWDDDSEENDPDSGENKLFSMMDELVQELMIELKDDDGIDEDVKAVNKSVVVHEENDESAIMNTEELTYTTIEIPDESTKDDTQNQNNIIESDDSCPPSPARACTSSEDCDSSESKTKTKTISSQPRDDGAEKHVKLHEQVNTLLLQVTELTNSMNAQKKIKAVKNEYNDKVSANIQRKIMHGDYNADRLEHLMGAIATYSKFREANTNEIPSLSSPSPPSPITTVKIKKNKKKKRTNKHKRRKSKSFVHTQQSLLILQDSLLALDEKLSREKILSRH
jgi:hypothetical protein